MKNLTTSILSVVTAMSLSVAVTAQETPFNRYKPVVLELGDGSAFLPARLDGLFSHFEVIDARPDTARVGIHIAGWKSAGSFNRQLKFAQPASKHIAGYLNRHFARPEAPYKALIVLRTLWMSDAAYIKEELMKAPEKRFEKTHIRLKAEVYALRDSNYIPVFRYDTLKVSLKGTYEHFNKDLASVLYELADSASKVIALKRSGSRTISIDDIKNFNQARFEPAICGDSAMRKGVYASFEEFRNNAPSILNYEVKKSKNNIVLYINEAGGNSYYSHNAWGYCDGANIYIMKDGTLRPAWREGKAWYFFGPSYKNPAGGVVPGAAGIPITSDPYLAPTTALVANVVIFSLSDMISRPEKEHEHPRANVFALDMDNGRIY